MLGADRGNFTRQTTNNTLWAGLIFVDRQGQGGLKTNTQLVAFARPAMPIPLLVGHGASQNLRRVR
jgi:hypothetical protein